MDECRRVPAGPEQSRVNPGGIRAPWIEATWPVNREFLALTTTRITDALAVPDFDTGTGAPASVPESSAGREWLRKSTVGPGGHLQWLRQVHGDHCIRANLEDCTGVPEADAAWTDATGLGLVIQTADCVPVAIADSRSGRIGVAHGGWRGLASGVVGRLVNAMGQSTSLVAWIGPAIGRDAYEVGEDVRSKMCQAFDDAVTGEVFTPGTRPDKWQLDLHALTAKLLANAGVNRVYGDRLCTFSDARFHSHRRERSAGRMATVIWRCS